MYSAEQHQADMELFWAPYNADSVDSLNETIPRLSTRIAQLSLTMDVIPLLTTDKGLVLFGAAGPSVEALTSSLEYAIGLSEHYRAKDWAGLAKSNLF